MPSGELARYEVIAGHHGLAPITNRTTVVTILRDPADRAWSHFRQLRYWPRGAERVRFDSFTDFLHDPVYRSMGENYQARWLAIAPDPLSTDRTWLPPGPPPSDEGTLGARALATLRSCALVGTMEQLDEFVEALARLTGRPLATAPRLNVTPEREPVPAAGAELVRRRSPVDMRLLAAADEALDRSLASLPALPPEPVVELPYEYTMSDPLYGTGWHARLATPDVGWHRWTGPGTRSLLRLPVRARGPARLELSVVSACDDAAIRSMRIEVQGRQVAHVLEQRSTGVAAIASVHADPRTPLTIAIETAHARHLVDSATGEPSPDPAGLAVGSIRLTRAAGGEPT